MICPHIGVAAAERLTDEGEQTARFESKRSKIIPGYFWSWNHAYDICAYICVFDFIMTHMRHSFLDLDRR